MKNVNRPDLAVFAGYYKNHLGKFALDMFLCVLSTAADLLFPVATRHAINTLLPALRYKEFFLLMAALLAAYLLRGLVLYAITIVGHSLGVLMEADMREDIFSHVQTLSYSFFDRNRTGELLSRMTTDLFEITELAHHGPENLLEALALFIGAFLILLRIRWELALILFAMIPLFLLFVWFTRERLGKASLQVKQKTAEINVAVETGVSGARTVKAFAGENRALEGFRSSNEAFKRSKKGYYRVLAVFMSGSELFTSLMQLAVVAAGGAFILKGRMDLADLITFSLYIAIFITPVRKLTNFVELFQSGWAGFRRFLEILRTEPEIRDDPDAVELTGVQGRVDYEHVDFAYSDAPDVPVLRDVCLSLAPGETLALVGPSGGGKTTLSQLLPRFYDVTGGAVKLDGTDVRRIKQDSLHRFVGIIQQDVFLFAGTVMDNIRFGRPDATDAEVMEAARRAAIHEEILAMPKGYETQVGERGAMLSGGQRQRIAIARVFLKDPPVLVLDEATSALDSVTEQAIQQSLEELSAGRTVMVIAHRLSTVRGAHRIAVVEDARIAEYGSHEELLAKDGLYAGLWRAQKLN